MPPNLKSIGKKAKKLAGFTVENILDGEKFLNSISRIPHIDQLQLLPDDRRNFPVGQAGTNRVNDLKNLPVIGGLAAEGFKIAASPLSIATAGLGGPASAGLKTLGRPGRIASGFVSPVLEGGNFATRIAAETGVALTSKFVGEKAEEIAPEPLKPYAGIAGNLIGGAAAIRSVPRTHVAPPTTGVGAASVDKITQILNAAKPIREEQSRLKAAELGARGARFKKSYEAAGFDPAGFSTARQQLAGQLPTAQFALPPGTTIDPADTSALMERIYKYYPSNMPLSANSTTEEFLDLVLNQKLPTKGGLREFERIFGTPFVNALLKQRTFGQLAHENIIDVVNLPRAIMSSTDISAPLNQGAMAVTRKEWWSSWKPMLKAFASEKHAKNAAESIVQSKYYARGEKAGLFEASLGRVGNREEAFASRFAKLIPGVAASERAYVTFLNKLRWDLWENVHAKYERLGIELTAEDDRKLANVYNVLTGRGNMPGREVADTLNAFLFSPRRLTSIVERMAYAPVALVGSGAEHVAGRQLLPGSRVARSEAARDLVGFIGAGTAALTLMNLSGLATVEVDPRSPDFGKGRIGNIRYDPWGGFQQIARYATQIVSGVRKDSSGEIVKASRGEVFGRFVESKLAPVQGAVVDIWRGRTMMGDSVEISKSDDIKEQLANRLVPLFLQTLSDAAKLEGVMGMIKALPSVAGVGVQTYESIADVQQRVLEDAARSNPALEGKKWDSLTPGQQQDLQEQHKDDFDKVRTQSDYEDERVTVEEWARTEQRNAATALADPTNPITPEQFRASMEKIQQDRRTRLDQARKDFGVQFKDDPNDVVGKWYKLREEATKAYGIVDPQQLDAFQEEFYSKLDDDGKAKVDDLREYRPDPTVQWYFDDKKTIADGGYWDAQKDAIEKFRSKLPRGVDTIYGLMSAIQAAPDEGTAYRLTSLLNVINNYTRVQRQILRGKNPALDAALVRIYAVTPISQKSGRQRRGKVGYKPGTR